MEKNFEDMGELFNSIFGGNIGNVKASTKSIDGGWSIKYPVPGYTKDMIDIAATSKHITIKSKLPETVESEYSEFIKPFNLSYKAPESSAFKDVDVKIEHGILNVVIKSEVEDKIKVNYN
jgi:HSP20 family molecular chaperone IbpA